MAQKTLQHGPAALQPFQGPSCGHLVVAWEHLRASYATVDHELLPPAFPPQLTDAVVVEQLPALQRSLASHLSDVAAEAALAASSPDRRAVLRIVSCHPAASWLTAKPS